MRLTEDLPHVGSQTTSTDTFDTFKTFETFETFGTFDTFCCCAGAPAAEVKYMESASQVTSSVPANVTFLMPDRTSVSRMYWMIGRLATGNRRAPRWQSLANFELANAVSQRTIADVVWLAALPAATCPVAEGAVDPDGDSVISPCLVAKARNGRKKSVQPLAPLLGVRGSRISHQLTCSDCSVVAGDALTGAGV